MKFVACDHLFFLNKEIEEKIEYRISNDITSKNKFVSWNLAFSYVFVYLCGLGCYVKHGIAYCVNYCKKKCESHCVGRQAW